MSKPPVNIRNTMDDYADDPYIAKESLQDNTVCKNCGAVYMSCRWYTKDAHSARKMDLEHAHAGLCPACQKMRDRVPGGVLKMSGGFIWAHRDDILNLIRNEANDALGDNPLERVMSIETVGDEVHIATTNAKLAQRLGRALRKAYHGEIEYKWSDDNKLARVNWHREE